MTETPFILWVSLIGLGEDDAGGGVGAGVDVFAGAGLFEGYAADGGFGFFFDFGFDFFVGGEPGFDEAAGFDEFFEFFINVGFADIRVAVDAGFFEHGFLDGLQLGAEPVGGDGGEGDDFFGAVEAFFDDHCAAGGGIHVAGADFDAEGDAALFPVELFVAGAVVAPVDEDDLAGEFVEEVAGQGSIGAAAFGGGDFLFADELHEQFVDKGGDFLLLFGGFENGNNGDEAGGDVGGKDEAFIIAVGHDHCANQTRRDAPTGGPGVFEFLVAAEEFDFEGFGKILAEEVGGAGLEGFAILHEGFDAVGGDGAGEFFRIGFGTLDHGNREEFLGEGGVDIEHAQGFGAGFGFGFVGGVAFLPEEFGGAEEEAGAHFPAHDVAPLVDQEGQVAVGLDPLGVHVADDGFGGGADDERLFELAGGDEFAVGAFLQFRVRDDGALHGEAFYMFGLFGQERLGDQEGEVGVDVAGLLEAAVEVALDAFPDGETFGADDHAAFDGGIVGELGGLDDVEVPLGVILGAGFDIFGHCASPIV